MTTRPIRVLVADDHPVVREGLSTLIDGALAMEVVGVAADGVEAVQGARARQPDIAVVDLVMPRMDGLAAIEAIRRVAPAVRLLVLTAFAQEGTVLAAIKAGAQSYLLKEVCPANLVAAIRDTHQGISVLHPTIAHTLIHALYHPLVPDTLQERLTEREVEVLRLVAQGLTNHQIAERLVISQETARSHVSNILHKLHLENRTAAALWALQNGLVDAHPGGARVRGDQTLARLPI